MNTFPILKVPAAHAAIKKEWFYLQNIGLNHGLTISVKIRNRLPIKKFPGWNSSFQVNR
ncbi:MAG: hypothetical protein LAT67_15325 [Balneolales bacterium]|nr:hypothetical protein [Balneolales bacterium]